MSTANEPIQFDATLIATEFKAGSSLTELAADYGISRESVESIIRLALVTQQEEDNDD